MTESTVTAGGATLITWIQSRIGRLACSLIDQACAAGALFIVNVELARHQTKEEYGLFVLSYSIYTFLASLYNAAVLEPYTVFGSGKYQVHFASYRRLMMRNTILAGIVLTLGLALVLAGVSLVAPAHVSGSLIGLTLTSAILPAASFFRRTFYILGQPHRAAAMSMVFLLAVCGGLWLSVSLGWLNGFSAFIIVAAGWIVSGLCTGASSIFAATSDFGGLQPDHWAQHWKYARWVLATSFVFQLTSQGYYWLVAGVLSAREVAELRAMSLIVNPTEQIFIALGFLVLPKLAQHHAHRRRAAFFSLWRRYELLTCAITGSLFVLVWFWGRPLVHWLYDGKFDNASGALTVLAAVPFAIGVGNVLNEAMKAIERPHVVFFAYLASGLVTFAIGIPLVSHLGLQGAVTGMLLSAIAYSVLLITAFIRICRSPTFHEHWRARDRQP